MRKQKRSSKLLKAAGCSALAFMILAGNIENATANTVEIASAELSLIKAGANSLRNRLGELRFDNPEATGGVWIRGSGKNIKISDAANTSMNVFGIEGGMDNIIYESETSKAYLGLMAGYLYADDIDTDTINMMKSTGSGYTPSLGLYASWMNNNGWFVDAAVRYFRTNMDITTTGTGGGDTYHPDRDFFTGSVEVGKKMTFGESNSFTVEPKAAVGYAFAKKKSMTTSMGNALEYGDTESLTTRLAVQTGYQFKTDSGKIFEPFVELGVTREWKGETDITYTGSPFTSDLGGTTGEIILGLNAKLSEGISLHTGLSYENGSSQESLGADLGIRVTLPVKKQSRYLAQGKTFDTDSFVTASAFAVPASEKIAEVHFAFDSSKLTDFTKETLREAAKQIKAEPERKIIVAGHTDSVGSDAYNQKLSERRANAAYNYLKQLGVDDKNIEIQGKGESAPIATNETAEGRMLNRRVEIFIK